MRGVGFSIALKCDEAVLHLNAVQFSVPDMECLRRMLAGETVTQETSGMPKGEWREFEAMLKG